jgi:hypothetical protein
MTLPAYPTSYSSSRGIVIMIIETRSVPGESSAPAMQDPTTANRRNRARSAGPITSSHARMMMTSGSSNESPSASTTCSTKSK